MRVARGEKLNIVLRLKEQQQQVVVSLDNLQSKHSASFVFSKTKQEGKLEATIDLSLDKHLHKLSQPGGVHAVTVFVAAKDTDAPIAYRVGDIELDTSFAGQYVENEAGDVFTTLPELLHALKPPQKMASDSLATAFTVITLSPWILVLLPSWLLLGANVRSLFASASMAVYGTLFLTALALMLYVLYLYWLRLTIFSLIAYEAILAVPTALLGRQALVARVQSRQ